MEESKRQKNDHDTAPSSVSDFDVSTHQIEGGQQTNDNNNYSVSSFEDISTSANNNNNNDLDQTSLLSEPVAQGITEISGGGGGGGDGGVGASANDSTFLTGGKDASPMAELELFEREFVNNSFSSVESHSFGLPSSSKEVLSGIPVTQNLFMIEDSNSVKESQKLEQIAKLSTTALITTPSLSSTQQQPIEKSSYVQQPLTSTKDYTINFSTTKHTESQQHHTKDELDFLEFKRVQEKEDKKQQYRFNMLQISDLGIEDLRKTMEDQERLIRGVK